MLFVLLGLFATCLVVAVGLLAMVGWTRHVRRVRYDPGHPGGSLGSGWGRWSHWPTTAVAVVGIGLTIVSWSAVLVITTPSGIVQRLVDVNPVMFVLLFGYSCPGLLGGYLLYFHRRDRSGVG